MKNLLNSTLFLLATLPLLSQTDGISYQAVIIAPYAQELPGVDVQGNILPNAAIAIRFTILDLDDVVEFQEEQFTQTDDYGRINLVIGSTNKDAFSQISWDGTTKNLLVEIDFESGGDYLELSKQELLFVPYAYHRNITATGTLKVDGPTELFSSLRVHNNTILEKNLTVKEKGTARFFGKVRIDSTATFYDHFTVDSAATATFLGPVEFGGPAAFNSINVEGGSSLNGQVTIDYNTGDDATDNFIGSYPLLVHGSKQGIAIKVNGNRSLANNYMSFWDSDGITTTMWGRIEGITLDELKDDPEYRSDHRGKILDIITATADVVIAGLESVQGSVNLLAAFSSSTACAGIGACITVPIPSLIIAESSSVVLKIANVVQLGGSLLNATLDEIKFIEFRNANIGVSYSSGAGDYAEWLPKQNAGDAFMAGELVGVKDGMVTKNLWNAEKVMIVSTNPIVLGNMPQPTEEKNYVKIAFMGQVPVKVLGNVEPGDYILPSILGSGFASCVHPEDMRIEDYKKVAGVAWNVMEKISAEISVVNVAVGINTNDLSDIIARQEEEIKALKHATEHLENQIMQTNTILSDLVPGYAEAVGTDRSIGPDQNGITYPNQENHSFESHIAQVDEEDIVYFEIPKDLIENGIEMSRQLYKDMLNNTDQLSSLLNGPDKELFKDVDKMVLMPIEDHPFWQKMDNDPGYREEVIQYVQSNLEKAYHTHKAYAHNFNDLKVR